MKKKIQVFAVEIDVLFADSVVDEVDLVGVFAKSDQNIIGLDVSVEEILAVHVFDDWDELVRDFDDVGEGNWFELLDDVGQVSAQQLHDHNFSWLFYPKSYLDLPLPL